MRLDGNRRFGIAGLSFSGARGGSGCPGFDISAVNLSEVAGRFLRDGHEPGLVRDRLSRLPLEVVPFDQHAAFATAGLQRTTSHLLGLSLGGRACLSLAKERNLIALTADRAWLQVEGIQVEAIR